MCVGWLVVGVGYGCVCMYIEWLGVRREDAYVFWCPCITVGTSNVEKLE